MSLLNRIFGYLCASRIDAHERVESRIAPARHRDSCRQHSCRVGLRGDNAIKRQPRDFFLGEPGKAQRQTDVSIVTVRFSEDESRAPPPQTRCDGNPWPKTIDGVNLMPVIFQRIADMLEDYGHEIYAIDGF